MAVSAAIAAFRYPDGTPGSLSVNERQSHFNLLWSYYSNETFSSLSAWSPYREQNLLYRNIRSIYNPTRRLVNFYVAQVYPGVLSEDASKLPDGVSLAIPLTDDTEDDVKVAIAQFWVWANWQKYNKLMVRNGGITGSSLVEIFDNFEKGKVSTSVVWPGLIAPRARDGGPGLVLDDSGNMKFYALEHQATEPDGTTYTYRKEVSQDSFRYFRDDVPTSPDGVRPAEEDNPYGFVPAVWCKHVDEGFDYGAPAIAGSIAKIDEVNGLASHTHDQVDRVIESPGIIASSGRVGLLGQEAAAIKTAAADEFNVVSASKEKPTKLLILKGPEDTKWIPMAGNLSPDQVIPLIQEQIREIEHDFPELSMYTELRKMSQITGPAAERLLGDVKGRVLEVASNYDVESIKLFQMALAIGGYRFKQGQAGWREKTKQRQKFAPFGLDSYAKDELQMSIMPRPLIPMTEDDAISLTGKRLENAKKAKEVFSEPRVLDIAGISDPAEQAAEMALLQKEREASAKLLPAGPRPPNGDSQLIQ